MATKKVHAKAGEMVLMLGCETVVCLVSRKEIAAVDLSAVC